MVTHVACDKESSCQCRRCKRHGFDPWVKKISWGRKWKPIPVFLTGKLHGQRSLEHYSPWSHKELDLIAHTYIHIYIQKIFIWESVIKKNHTSLSWWGEEGKFWGDLASGAKCLASQVWLAPGTVPRGGEKAIIKVRSSKFKRLCITKIEACCCCCC